MAEETGRFIFGITRLEDEERIGWQVQAMNKNIPLEIVLMKMKAWIDVNERDYFDDFKNSTFKTSPS